MKNTITYPEALDLVKPMVCKLVEDVRVHKTIDVKLNEARNKERELLDVGEDDGAAMELAHARAKIDIYSQQYEKRRQALKRDFVTLMRFCRPVATHMTGLFSHKRNQLITEAVKAITPYCSSKSEARQIVEELPAIKKWDIVEFVRLFESDWYHAEAVKPLETLIKHLLTSA